MGEVLDKARVTGKEQKGGTGSKHKNSAGAGWERQKFTGWKREPIFFPCQTLRPNVICLLSVMLTLKSIVIARRPVGLIHCQRHGSSRCKQINKT